MMGRVKSDQGQLFYEFHLGDAVPEDHLVRKIDTADAIPDDSAFSRARNGRFREGDVFRHVFERVAEACISAGLFGGDGFAVAVLRVTTTGTCSLRASSSLSSIR